MREKNCRKCRSILPATAIIDGKRRSLKNRKFCFVCSPFGSHNTKKDDPSRPNKPPRVKPKKGHGGNQYTLAKELGLPKPIVTQETRDKISRKSSGRLHSKETKDKLSASMKRAVEMYPESYNSSNRGRTKQIIVDGIKFQGKWELLFYNWCKDNNIQIRRCSENFPYNWNGSRKYFPDFYLTELNIYAEVKGYKTDRDKAKWSQFPHQLLIVQKQDIERIRNGTFSLNTGNYLK